MFSVFGFLILMVLLCLGLVSSHHGWIELPVVLDLAMILLGLSGLAGVLKLPWDLYFQARGLVLDQTESRRRGLEVADDEVAYGTQATRRLLFLCLFTHLLAAALSASLSYFSGGKIGYAFAVFFLVSTAFRPMGAFYTHMTERLRDLRKRARVPRQDAIDLRARLEQLELRSQSWERQSEELQRQLQDFLKEGKRDFQTGERRREELAETVLRQGRDFESKVDRVCREFEASIARLSSDREVLDGIRAFVRLVKES